MLLMLCCAVVVTGALMGGCAGDDGAAGAAGAPGAPGADASAIAKPESCIICHEDQGAAGHQAIYNDYVDTTLAITIDSVTSVASGTLFNTTVEFTVLKNGQPYTLTGSNNFRTEFDQETIYSVLYSSAARTFGTPKNFLPTTGTIPTSLGNGQFSITGTGLTYAPESSNAQVYIYVAKGRLNTEGMALYADVANIGQEFGDVDTYASTANVSGCEKCHGAPYRKHGYRQATVSGLPDFAACKVCHYDDRTGGHQSWQLLVDDLAKYTAYEALVAACTTTLCDSIEDNMTTAEKNQYAYTANVMNDTHMSHGMEFMYPQTMANCVTCHEGKLNLILTDANFNLTTCRSCHPVTGVGGTDSKRAPDLTTILSTAAYNHNAYIDNLYVDGAADPNCAGCHFAGGTAPVFSAIHTGYNSMIFAADGTKYADAITATISSATFTNNILNIKFSAADTLATGFTVTPSVYVSLYGYDAKDFLVSCHTSDANGKRMEKTIGTANTLFTEVATTVANTWEVNLDLAAYAKTPSIPQMIADGTIKRMEIAVLLTVKDAAGVTLGIDAPSKTFDIASNGFVTYYAPIVDAAKCNTCHEQLATTFHSGNRGGNVVVCRMCHTTFSGGSHLELQSRSIDSYVHAIHSFQPFDIGDVDFTNPEETLHVQHHIEATFPNFTIKNCEACHTTAGVYEVPNQTKSLPGILSGSDYVEGRNINNVPSYVSGPATRACGGCHRAVFVNEDDANGLASFNEHTKTNGYLIPNATGVLDTVIQTIMSYFD
jgi:OmcA/MtrC family decaheme c-type cytochrome